MNKVTYLFGAGASFNALPIVNQIPQRLKELISLLKDPKLHLDDVVFSDLTLRNNKTQREFQTEMIDDLEWMMKESLKHASIDTFAKKLYIKKSDKELDKLKIVLSIFFILEQAQKGIDLRYDSFFAAILNDLYRLPENVRILSWNYDSQFEKTFSHYTDRNELSENQYRLNIKSKGHYSLHDDFNMSQFGIYKLNGSTSLYHDREYRYTHLYNDLKVQVSKDLLLWIVRNYAQVLYGANVYSLLSFAWEKEWTSKSILGMAAETTKETNTLVVIGYSFPFFNREIDKMIIGNMANLKKVYFQAPDAENLKERFQALRDDIPVKDLIVRFDTEQFLLPNEL